MARTHVLYIAEFSTGGSIESLIALLTGLDKDRFKATVLFYTMPEERICDRVARSGAAVRSLYPYVADKGARQQLRKLNLQRRVRRIFGERIERRYVSLKFILHFLRFWRGIYRDLRNQIEAIDPDLVHLNNGIVSDTPGLLAGKACGKTMVCHAREFSTPTWLSRRAGRSVSAFVCISRAVRDHLVDSGIDATKCAVVPNAVDVDQFNEAAQQGADIRSEHGWDRSHTVFALIGRIVSWKGQDEFIKAIAEALEQDGSIRGLIVGEGDDSDANKLYIEQLHRLVDEHDLEGKVVFTGHRTDVPGIMKAADVVVCASSLPEPFGRVIIESMAVGTPVIATDAGGTIDIIADNENGLLVAIKDSSALAQAMSRLSQDEQLMQRLRDEALRNVHDRYTVRHHAELVSDVYRRVLS